MQILALRTVNLSPRDTGACAALGTAAIFRVPRALMGIRLSQQSCPVIGREGVEFGLGRPALGPKCFLRFEPRRNLLRRRGREFRQPVLEVLPNSASVVGPGLLSRSRTRRTQTAGKPCGPALASVMTKPLRASSAISRRMVLRSDGTFRPPKPASVDHLASQ